EAISFRQQRVALALGTRDRRPAAEAAGCESGRGMTRSGDSTKGRRNVLVFMGTRPEAIKLAPVVAALRSSADFDCTVVATGQHREMRSEEHTSELQSR